jgi:hypothetical protein
MEVTLPELMTIIDQGKDNPESLKKQLRVIFSYPENLPVYSQFFFPEVITTSVPIFHKQLYTYYSQKSSIALAAPRGHAKSTTMGLVFISWSVVNNLEKYIVYISQNHAKTIQFITPLRDTFKRNERLKWIYGDLSPELAKDEDGKDREDCIDVNNIRIEAISFEKNLRGFKYKQYRPSLICLDDIESDDRVINPEMRIKDRDKLNKVIIPALSVTGRIIFVGTLLHTQSLLAEKIKQYGGKIYRAIDENDTILMPELYTKEVLARIKSEIGSLAFQQEFLNDPVDVEGSIIRPEWIKACFDTSISAEELRSKDPKSNNYLYAEYEMVCGGVDFAFSERVTADKSAFVTLARYNGQFYVLWGDTKRGLSISEQLLYIQTGWNSVIRHDIIGLEENSIKSVSKDLDSMNLPFKLFWTSQRDPKKEKMGDFMRQTVGKINLIHRMAVAFEHHRFVIPYKTDDDKKFADQLVQECTSYTLMNGRLVEGSLHPDIPIALGYALELVNSSVSPIISWGD